AEQRPWVAPERRLQPAGQVRLVDLAPADGRADRLDLRDPRVARRPGAERGRDGGLDERVGFRHGSRIRQVPAEEALDPALDAQPSPRRPLGVAVEGPYAQPAGAGPAVP